ncbi:acyltransferase [Congregibacter variabilis]|uniref:acyltransferase n=1 Tax=Congregibacter variabilis TaxID=3081200 RepID=UPI00388D09CD
MQSFRSNLIKLLSRVLREISRKLRLLYYNATVFGYYKPFPYSTTIYGRIRTLDTPCNVRLGKSCRIGDDAYFATTQHAEICISDEVNINLGCVFVSIVGISVGERTSIAEYVSIRDQEHRFDPNLGSRDLGYISGKVKIGKNVWIGRGVYIGPNVEIGDGSIVAANSVVRDSFPGSVLIAGAPATVKRTLVTERP